jgi:phage terminase large subunit
VKADRPKRGASMSADLALLAGHVVERHAARAWPAPEVWNDLPAFARRYLGYEPWSRQCEMLDIVSRNTRSAFASGHRTGKTDTIAIVAIGAYCALPDARVILVGPTVEQIDGAVYRAVRRLLLQSGRCVDCRKADPNGPRPCPHSALITGEVHSSSHHGVKSTNDLREIRGVNVRSQEAAQGIAGENVVILGDEASGEYLDKIMGALAGNRAGGARFALFGNPIRSTGEFAEAFGAKSDFYETRRISSEESPNVTAGKVVIPGLATAAWVEEQIAEYGGRESPFFLMRVLGRHVTAAEGAIFPAVVLEAAVGAWKALRDPESGTHFDPPSGPLVIALDPAGESGDYDESSFCVRCDYDVLELYTRRGLSADAHVAEVLGLLERHRRARPSVRARVMLDAAGDVGARVRGAFIAYRAAHPEAFDAFAISYVQSGNRAERDPGRYQTVRDEMAAVLADWFRHGGGIPDDPKLKIELSRFAWIRHVTDRAKATPKEGRGGLREQLGGRSCDRADAVMLSTWAPVDRSAEMDEQLRTRPASVERVYDALPGFAAGGALDIYESDFTDPRRRGR